MDSSSHPLGVTSIVPRALRHELVRERLLARLEQAQDARIVALLAPSGYGKTTLLAQFARRVGEGVVWVTLSEEHALPLQLALTLAAGLAPFLPEALRLDSQEGPGGAEAIFTRLTRALNASERNVRVVLDGAHHLSTSSAQWLETFAAALGEGHQLLLTAYEGVALRLARFLALGEAVIIGSGELALSPEESAHLLTARGYPGDARATHEALEGWPTGIALVASGAGAYVSPEDLVLDTLRTLPPDVGRALPELSVFGVWSEQVAVQHGVALPPGWLDTVRQSGLPLAPLDRWQVRPHQVLLDALGRLLRQRSPERYAALCHAAGQEAEGSGQPLTAVRRYLEGGHLAPALRVAGELVPQLRRRVEYRPIYTLISAFPEDVLPPELKVALADILVEFGELDRAETLLLELGGGGYRSAAWSYARCGVLMGRGKNQQALDAVEQGLALAPEVSLRLMMRRAQAHLLQVLGRYEEAHQVAGATVAEAEGSPDRHDLAACLVMLARTARSRGQPAQAELLLHRAIATYEGLGTLTGTLAPYHELAELCRSGGRFEEGLGYVHKALPVAEQRKDRHLPSLYLAAANLHRYQGEWTRATEMLELARASCIHTQNHTLAQFIGYTLVDVLHHAGRPEQAGALLRQLRGGLSTDSALVQQVAVFHEALDAFCTGDLTRAAAGFEEVVGSGLWRERAARAQAFLLEIARRAGPLRPEQFAGLAALVGELGGLHVLRQDARWLAPLYREGLASGGLPETFQPLVQDQGLAGHAQSDAPRGELRVLGRFQLTLGGQPTRIPSAKARELLTFLALEGPGTRERIIDALWDGEADERHVEHFKVIVRRLRATLGAPGLLCGNPVPFEDGTYRLSNHLSWSLDVLELRRALTARDAPALHALLAQAQPEFLPDLDSQWAQEVRASCREDLLAAALVLGELLEADDPGGAIWAYRRALEIEPLDDEAHRRLIRLLHARHDLAGARRAEHAYGRMLREERGEPLLLDEGQPR